MSLGEGVANITMVHMNLKDYLTIKQAAEFLGVSPATLRRWDKAGKLRAIKNPMNNYRLYRKDELEAFLRRLEESKERKQG